MRPLSTILLLLGLIGAGCHGGVQGHEDVAWFESNLGGSTQDWPRVAAGSVYTVEIELDDCFGELEDQGPDVISSDPEVLQILGVESWCDAGWFSESGASVEIEAVGEGTAMIEVVDPDGISVDRISAWVAEPERVRLSHQEIELDGAVAVVRDSTARVDVDLLNGIGEVLGYRGLGLTWPGDEGPLDAGISESGDQVEIHALRADARTTLDVAFGGLRQSLTVHPVDEVAALDVVVTQETRRRFDVVVAGWSADGEWALTPPFDVDYHDHEVSSIELREDGFTISAVDSVSPMKVRISSGSTELAIGVRDRALLDRTYEEVVEDGPVTGCAVVPSSATGLPALAGALVLLTIYRRRMR